MTPMNREEVFLNGIAEGTGVDLTPMTREEVFLDGIANGKDVDLTPMTRREVFLKKIAGNSLKPTNMITNGDFSEAGATADGWHPLSPEHSEVAVSDGKLVLTHTQTSNRAYGVYCAATIKSGHSYLVRFKLKKTMTDSDSDAKCVTVRFVKDSTVDYLSTLFYMTPVTQDTVVESVCAFTASDAYDKLLFCFGGLINTTASNESMLEFSYVELYDITEIVSGW